ncbi:ribonuclease HI [Novosphingobium sp. PP1Y]|uniref:ribonuclease HI n=1 Tax=Novosphingobium sp. PP1Y TaxID=702113 RepID=UPI00020EF7C9|nr:reverse transcriptase-like protein [Novosphingobium sp. PP1Y]CCA90178.1 ribonuclease HI [Novosphingobium sp. PP1Y]
MARRRVKVFFDGGSRPNPGRMEAAVVVRGKTHLFEDMGHGSNGDAEWLALVQALEVSRAMDLTDVELIGDAREVVQKANLAMRGEIAPHRHVSIFLALAHEVRPGRIRWIKREQNLAGIALARRHPR